MLIDPEIIEKTNVAMELLRLERDTEKYTLYASFFYSDSFERIKEIKKQYPDIMEFIKEHNLK